jgi:hypothetical protein
MGNAGAARRSTDLKRATTEMSGGAGDNKDVGSSSDLTPVMTEPQGGLAA